MTSIAAWIDGAAARWSGAAYLEDAHGPRTVTYAGLRRCTRAWQRRLDDAGVPPGARVGVRLADPLDYATALVEPAGRRPGGGPARSRRPGRRGGPGARGSPAGGGGQRRSRGPAAGPAGAHRACPGRAGTCPGRAGGCPGRAGTCPGRAGTCPGRAGGCPGRAAGGIFLCTSGTTGSPKGVLLSERQLTHVAVGVAIHHRLTPADRGYCCLPLFHVNAEVVGLLATLAARACLVLDRRFSRRGFWAAIEDKQVTWINAVPAIITVLAADPAAAPSPGLVRFVRSASAPLPPSVLGRFERAFGIPVVETYGMTEAASMITANPLHGPRKAGSAGLPAGAEVRVVQRRAAEGQRYLPCPAGTVGRVQIRGRGVISEYAENGPAGAIDPDGWLDTGDLGHLDQDGYLFLAGRSDDVINRGGEKIYPREIEDVLLAQPGVRFAAVVAARDEVLGERPVAYVVPTWPGAGQPLEDALREACEAALPRPKRPAAFHLVAELPVGPTGKVARRRLQELAGTRVTPSAA